MKPSLHARPSPPEPLELTDRDHTVGAREGTLTLVEYGDYECPFCGQAQAAVTRLLSTAGHRLLFVYRHFPLAQKHPHAAQAAETAEAAGRQHHFWEMHQRLYARQRALNEEDLLRYAVELGLDDLQVARELEAGTHRDRVLEDLQSGVQLGVTGVPSFFINGRFYEGEADYESLWSAVAHEL